METKLGRGLSALLGDLNLSQSNKHQEENIVDIDLLVPNKNQPRKIFDDDELLELTDSIANYGVLQPIVVRKNSEVYEIIAGERRWRAAKLANLNQVPVHVLDCSDQQAMIYALIENLQRTDLNPVEEAEAIKELMNRENYRQEDVANIISKSRSHVANILRLLTLPESVLKLVKTGRLSFGHAKILIGRDDCEELAQRIVDQKLTIRQTEDLIKDQNNVIESKKQESVGTRLVAEANPEAIDLAARISHALKVETKLKITKKGGVFTLFCKSCEELERLVELFTSLSFEK